MADEFFQEKQPETPAEPEKIKIGEKEYTQEELTELAGLGEQYKEIETKQNIKLDRVYPEFTKSRQEIAELKKQVGEFQEFQNRIKGVEPSISPEDLKAQAKQQLEELGGVTVDKINDYIDQRLQAARLLDEVEGLRTETKTAGKPEISTEDLLKHMSDTGIRSPEKAYKDKFENELKEWEQKKLGEIKPQGFTTQESAQGNKEPVSDVPRTKDDLDKALDSFFKSQGGAENA